MVFNTNFGNSSGFTIYSWIRVSLAKFIPLILISIFNTLLVNSVSKVKKSIKSLNHTSDHTKIQYKVSIMLISVSVVFLIGHFPDCISQYGVYKSIFGKCSIYQVHYIVFRLIANILEMTSSSSNFIIYCITIEHFPKSLRNYCSFCVMYRCCSKQKNVVKPTR